MARGARSFGHGLSTGFGFEYVFAIRLRIVPASIKHKNRAVRLGTSGESGASSGGIGVVVDDVATEELKLMCVVNSELTK